MSVDLLPMREVIYPESDGEPMGENTIQVRWINFLLNGFEALFEKSPDVFVAADLFWYPIEGDPRTVMAPDLMIAFGRPKGDRSSYLQWKEEGLAPQVVWEVLSPSNSYAEMQKKFRFYDRFGVEEYYIYDPESYKLDVWVRDAGSLKFVASPHGYTSLRTGVRFEVPGTEPMVIFQPDGQPFLSYLESIKRAEIEYLRAQAERRKAESEKRNAEAAEQQAEVQKQRADRYAEKMRKLGLDPDQE